MESLEDYPFDPYFSFPNPRTIEFWKKHLKEEFIIAQNFHRDLLYRSSKTSLEKWADYKKIPVNELLTVLERNQKIEEDFNQTLDDDFHYKMKVESPFNDPLIVGVTPDAMTKPPKTYKLQDAHSLYTEIAKLDVFDIKSLLRFLKHFGMPSGIMDDIGFDIILDGDFLLFPFGSISVLNKKIAIYKRDFEWFQIIQTNKLSKIYSLLPESEINDLEDGALINLVKII